MKVLTLGFKEVDREDVTYLKYVDGEISSSCNYVRETCEANYNVDFNYKGFDFSEGIVLTALTHYFDEKSSDPIISHDEFIDLFEEHSEHLEDEEMTEIKKITINYMRKILLS